MVCWLDLRVPPTETRLTVYCWLLILSQACVSETCLSVLFQVVVIVGGFNICIQCCWCFRCGRLLVVVGVGGASMFVRDVHFFQADSDLRCRIRVRVRMEDLFAGAFCCLIRLV